MKNDKDVSGFLGLSPDSITTQKRKGYIPPRWFERVVNQTEISYDWLVFGTGPMYRVGAICSDYSSDSSLDLEEYRLVPLLESRVTAGPEGAILYDEVADYLPFKRAWLNRLVGRAEERQGALLLVRVRGDSMSATIEQGEVALVDTHESERLNVQDGKIYLVMTPDGTVALKRLVVKQGEEGNPRLVCLSDNTGAYRPFSFTLDPGKSIKEYVLGRIRWAGKEFD